MPAPLEKRELPSAAKVLARAFQDDPGTVYLIPDPTHRAALLPAMFEVMVRYGLKHGQVYVDENAPRGVAVWLPPGETTPTDAGMGEAGIGGVVEQWGEAAMGRLGTLVADLEVLHNRLVEEPHWRVFFLGVEPEQQGKGIGSALLQARPSRPPDSTPTYLETFTLPNVRFYQRHGFSVIGENDMAESGIHVWSMLRR